MDFTEKVKIRLGHWITHNTHHIGEYKEFIEELKKAGQLKSASYLEDAVNLLIQINENLKKALNAVEE